MRRFLAMLATGVLAFALFACSSGGAARGSAALEGYPTSDMSGYECAAGYDKSYAFVDVTVEQIAQEMAAGKSFAVYAGYADCPWCNVMLNTLNDAAVERGEVVGYLDTRKDPSWQSNLDLEGYDTFVELFGSALDADDSGTPHLYVPHVFYVKDGSLVWDKAGTAPGQVSPSDALTEDQKRQMADGFAEGFDKIA